VKRCKVRLAVKAREDIPQNEAPSQPTVEFEPQEGTKHPY
jgi:hypothetical protein